MSQFNNDPKALVNRGNALFNSRNYQEALVNFDQAITLNPNSTDAWYGKGITLKNLKRHQEALASFDQVISLKPNFSNAWYYRGIALGLLKRHQEAIASFNQAINLKPDSPNAWYDRGIALSILGQYKEAIDSFNQVIALKPDFPNAQKSRRAALESLQRYGENKPLESNEKQSIKQKDSVKTQSVVNKEIINSDKTQDGLVFLQLGHYQEALASFDQAITINRNSTDTWCGIGNALYYLGRYEEAIISFDKALVLKPDYYEALYNRGIALSDLGRYEEAITSYDKALQFKPDSHEIWNGRGFALFDLGRYEEAITSFDKVLEFKPDYYEAWNNRGNALYYLGFYEEAIISSDKALQFKPDFHVAWNNRGNALYYLGFYEEAIISFDKALQFKPDYYEAWNGRGNALKNLGFYEEAIISFDKALQFKPDDHVAWNNRGNVLSDLGFYEEAITSRDKALQFKPDFHVAWNNRGIVAFKSIFCRTLVALSLPPSLRPSQLDLKENPKLDLDQRGTHDAQRACLYAGLRQVQPGSEGAGFLYHQLGRSHYNQSRNLLYNEAISHRKLAQQYYEDSLSILTFEQFPELHLEVLTDLIKLLYSLKETEQAETLARQATDSLAKLLENAHPEVKLRLSLKFSHFKRLTVSSLVRSEKLIEAWETAEQDKNACIQWLLSRRWEEVNTIKSPSFQNLYSSLAADTALIYWHFSPAALTTFILTPESDSPQVLNPVKALQQLNKLETWTINWHNEYQDFCDAEAEEKLEQPWFKNLPQKLDQLKDILDIPALLQLLPSTTRRLWLVPHQDLHLYPLHSLFPPSLICTYLPSAKVGLEPTSTTTVATEQLLYLQAEAEDLFLLDWEAKKVLQYFKSPQHYKGDQLTLEDIPRKLTESQGILHYSGHSQYNFDAPSQSALFLTNQLRLTAATIYNLNLHHLGLTVLSSCEPAKVGKEGITVEYVGLGSCFLSAGVSSVLSPLWQIDETFSAVVMAEFYRRLRQKKEPSSIALQNTIHWLRQVTNQELNQRYGDDDLLNHIKLSLQRELEQGQTHLEQLKAERKNESSQERQKELLGEARKLEETLQHLRTILQQQSVPFPGAPNSCPYQHPYYWTAFICQGV